MKLYVDVALVIMVLATLIPIVLGDCKSCTVSCGINSIATGESPHTLDNTCDDSISETLKQIGQGIKMTWHEFQPKTHFDRVRGAFSMAGSADLVGPTPIHPAAGQTFGGNRIQVNIVCPTICPKKGPP